MDMSELEEILGKDVSIVCFPLSLIIRQYVAFVTCLLIYT